MPESNLKKFALNVTGVILGGFIVALLIAECRETRSTHDAVIRLEEKLK